MQEQDNNVKDLAPVQTGLFAKAKQWFTDRWTQLKGLFVKPENNIVNENASGELSEEQLEKVTAGTPAVSVHVASREEFLQDLNISDPEVTTNNDELSVEDLDKVTAGAPAVGELSVEDLDKVTAGIPNYDDER